MLYVNKMAMGITIMWVVSRCGIVLSLLRLYMMCIHFREEQGTVLSSESEHLAQIIDAEQTIQQTSRETVLDAVEEVDQMVCIFHDILYNIRT